MTDGKGDAAVCYRALESELGHAARDNEPELHHQAGPALVSCLKVPFTPAP